jgi:formyltetrahydrofolate deformylase
MEKPVASSILTISCPSRRGIVAAISTYLAAKGCNIVDSSQFVDQEGRSLFMRVSFESEEGAQLTEIVDGFASTATAFDMHYQFHDATARMRVLIMVSRFGHCLNDLLYRWRIGALPMNIVGVVSNHLDFHKVVTNHDLPFHHIPVIKDMKPQAEARLMQLVEESGAELIVLARYMQVLSDDLCRKIQGRVINIHHSFLPSFKGANPYRQAYEHGVKLIGATAHYVTADLDEGPIIEQDTVRVTHAQSPDDYVALGRDVESQVLARAVHAHIHHRALLNGSRTVVFPPSPGDHASRPTG